MHREGHTGVALLAYAPVAFITAAVGFESVAFVGAIVAAGGAMVPDLDIQLPLIKHRGPTHTHSGSPS